MLHKSGHNLEKGVINFIGTNEAITLFSAYVKLEELKRINIKNNIKQIIVRWEVQDLCMRVSDLEIYTYCKENNIILYRNTRLHMKAFWNNSTSLVYGSAKVTGRVLGEANNYNYELNGLNEAISFADMIYLDKVIHESEYVTDELYNKLDSIVKANAIPAPIYEELPTVKSSVDAFLLSQLPMSISPDDLIDVISDIKNAESLELSCAAHDIVLFDLSITEESYQLKELLRDRFNSSPFIIALKKHIKSQPNQSLRYGGVVEWIQENTTTVPTPRRWEIKQDQIVNILYCWICAFDEQFNWDIPNHTQVIYFNKQLN
jgi:hypothetical protein